MQGRRIYFFFKYCCRCPRDLQTKRSFPLRIALSVNTALKDQENFADLMEMLIQDTLTSCERTFEIEHANTSMLMNNIAHLQALRGNFLKGRNDISRHADTENECLEKHIQRRYKI